MIASDDYVTAARRIPRPSPFFVLGLVCLIALGARLTAAEDSSRELQRDGVRTTGVVRDISGRVRRARIDVAYDAGGTPQRGHFFWNDRLRWDVGDPITLYYDTDEPSRMTVPGGESDSEPSYWLNIILAVGLIAGLLLGTVNSVQRRRRKLAIARVRYANRMPEP